MRISDTATANRKKKTGTKTSSFDDMAATVTAKAKAGDGSDSSREAQSVLGSHRAKISNAANKVKARVIKCHPSKLRMWAGHDRDYGLLDEHNCRDLIDGFERAGQQFPVIARPLKNNEEGIEYEIVCGARRHWTSVYRNKSREESLLVEVRNLTDEQAFVLQDIENRDRQDISDFERAVSYTRALTDYFDGVQSKMAKKLDMDEGFFSRLIGLADLPADVVNAYETRHDLAVSHMKTYSKFLSDEDSKNRIITRAKALRKQKDNKNHKALTGAEVLRELRAAGEGASKVTAKKLPPEGSVSFKIAKSGEITVKINPGDDKATTMDSVKRELAKIVKKIETTYS